MNGSTPVDYFNEVYDRFDRFWAPDMAHRYSTDPNDHPRSLITQLMLRLAARRPPGIVLDLGAGEGLDSIRLARLGYTVHAVEASPIGAAKIEKFATEMGVLVDVKICDVNRYSFDTQYDFVVCNGVLHYIRDKEKLIHRIQNATSVGGYNVISTWSSYSPVPQCHQHIQSYCDDEDGLIVKLYRSWEKELLYFERDKLETSHSDMVPHRHSFIKLIAMKPGLATTRRRFAVVQG